MENIQRLDNSGSRPAQDAQREGSAVRTMQFSIKMDELDQQALYTEMVRCEVDDDPLARYIALIEITQDPNGTAFLDRLVRRMLRDWSDLFWIGGDDQRVMIAPKDQAYGHEDLRFLTLFFRQVCAKNGYVINDIRL